MPAAAIPWITAAIGAASTGVAIHNSDVQGQESRHAVDVQQQAQDASVKQAQAQAANVQAQQQGNANRDAELSKQRTAAAALSGQAGTVLTGGGTGSMPNSVLGTILAGGSPGMVTTGTKTTTGA